MPLPSPTVPQAAPDPCPVAEAIALACRRAAAAIEELAEARAAAAREARAEWQGPAREAFDQAVRALDAAAADLAIDLRRLAARTETRR